MNRRDLIRALALGGGALAAAGAAYGTINGLRFPILQFEPTPRPTRFKLLDPDIEIEVSAAYIKDVERTGDGLRLTVRAFGPEPAIRAQSADAMTLELAIANLSDRAELVSGNESVVEEERLSTVNRRLVARAARGSSAWGFRVPFSENFRFGVIGDSGGGSELAWCLDRSAQLGADFVLHAGDFYYSDADLWSLPEVLERTPLPVYASIGNHDFHDDGRYVHKDFTRHVGPRTFQAR